MKVIDEHIKTGSFARAYLLFGDEAYLKQQYKNKLRNALLPEGDTLNLGLFEGKGIDQHALMDLANTMPFLSEHRVLIIENSGFFKSGNEDLAAFLKELPDTTCMIFVENEVDKRSKLYKATEKAGHVAEFKTPGEDVLIRWILGRLKSEKKNITRPVMELFLSKTGLDMSNIASEMEKLLCYTMDKDVIDAGDVEAICSGQLTDQIFKMVDAIGRRDQKRALRLYYDLLALKTRHMNILAMVNRQFRRLMVLKEMDSLHLDWGTMASKAGINPRAIRPNLQLAKNFSKKELRQALEDGVSLEEKAKTGQMNDQLAVEVLIVTYSAKQ